MNSSDSEPVSFWQAEPLAVLPWLRHGSSHRTGGFSVGDYVSLNTGLHVGDTEADVVENRKRTANACGFSLHSVVCAEQVHGAQVAVVGWEHAGRGARDYANAIPGIDSLVTDTPNLLLSLFFADCLPVFFADPVHRAVGIAHAGWKGLAGGVLQNTIRAMQATWGTDTADLLTAVGPGIGVRHFEVGPEVAARFPNETRFFPPCPKPHVDLRTAAARILTESGVMPAHICLSDDDTAALPDWYFSHRRDKGRTGRMMGVIGISNQNPPLSNL